MNEIQLNLICFYKFCQGFNLIFLKNPKNLFYHFSRSVSSREPKVVSQSFLFSITWRPSHGLARRQCSGCDACENYVTGKRT